MEGYLNYESESLEKPSADENKNRPIRFYVGIAYICLGTLLYLLGIK